MEWDGAGDAFYFFAVDEEDECRDGEYLEFGGCQGVSFGIQFSDDDGVLGFGKGFEGRSKDAAGLAPLGPEIHQYGFAGFPDEVIEGHIGQEDWACGLLDKDRGFASPAGGGSVIVFSDPVFCTAGRAFNNNAHYVLLNGMKFRCNCITLS